ncbi:MAG: hypothetical protein ACYTFK_00450 [Planctomycetota bacterium]
MKKKAGYVRCSSGSALILVIVITVLLATVGVMFVLMSRVGRFTTSAISDNRELAGAVDVVVNRINTVLAQDLFGSEDGEPYFFAKPPISGNRPDYSGSSSYNEPWDYPDNKDAWLASLEPALFTDGGTPFEPSDDIYFWPHISIIYPGMGSYGLNPPAEIAGTIDPNYADADGDGVVDSMWTRIPVSSRRGEPIFAAVRIIDNCAMLNLNTVHTADADSDGSYLSAVDYERFLRGREADPCNFGNFDDKHNIREARNQAYDPCDPDSYKRYHDEVIMNIENPNSAYSLFDIGDELEIRNRYMLTSPVEARFEDGDVANYTLDAGGGPYAALEIPLTTTEFGKWKWRIDHRNFEGDPCNPTTDNPEPYKYDRRHICTFYSFDRNLRRRLYPLVDVENNTVDPNRIDWLLENNPVFSPGPGVPVNINNDISSNTIESRRNILHLLYTFRAYFADMYPDAGSQAAARRSAQVVANMIDYIDNDDNDPCAAGPFFDTEFGDQKNDAPTYIDRDIIRELIFEVSSGTGAIDIDLPSGEKYDFGLGSGDIVYGYERQPFISELFFNYDDGAGEVQLFRVELCNPYTIPNGEIDLDGWRISVGSNQPHDFVSGDKIDAATSSAASGLERLVVNIGNPAGISSGDIVRLERPDPANAGEFITVDATKPQQTQFIDGVNVSKRDDRDWKFTDAGSYIATTDPCNVPASTLGGQNLASPNPPAKGFQMPVPNNNARLATLHDFEMVMYVGNKEIGDDPNAVTRAVASAESEADIRFDIASQGELLEYICFMNRPQGNLPGRININTATMEVIRAAIPPDPKWSQDADSLAQAIVDHRDNDPCNSGPFQHISDLLDVSGFKQMMSDPNSGDSIEGDFEDRDSILSRVSNIFTVRSDVFTAYILVRIGYDGPQKRMIAIFDRSGVYSPKDKPRLVALHPVPDPR